MEYVGQQNIKKLCNFYVSDLHLSVMLLPYLSKQINEDVEITTIFEKLNKEDLEVILDKLSVNNKKEILSINWLNKYNTNEEIKKIIESSNKNNKKKTIIIGGNKKFILENNDIIMSYLNNNIINSDIKIINCYNVEEVGKEMRAIVERYDGILNTSGEIAI
jgi:hypothetical protein